MENKFSNKEHSSGSDIKTRSILPIKAFLAFLIITSVTLPSANFLGVPVKHLAFASFLFLMLIQWIRGSKINIVIIMLLIISSIFVVFFLLLGTFEDFTHPYYVLSEGLIFFTTMAVAFSLLMARSMHIVEDEEIISYVFYGLFLFTLWKSCAGILASFGIVPFENIRNFFIQYLNYPPVAGKVYGNLYRINFIVPDFMSAAFLFFIPCFPSAFSRVPVLFRRAFFISGIACLIFSFSRFLFAMVAFSWIYIFFFRYSFKQRFLLVLVVIVAMIAMSNWTVEIFEERFTSDKAEYSDGIRIDQTNALMEAWRKTPFLGGGFGYYAKDYIRLAGMPYIYEVQWVSFLAKFGIFGISFLLFLILLLFYGIFRGKRSLDHYMLALFLFSYVISGFTNQYLLNAASAIFYIVHLSIASVLRKNLPQERPSLEKVQHNSDNIGRILLKT
ncbi:MAG: O-antigen ligase family protein [Betaproteobacteria bacterium]|nr:O-antigen ligase family protein [Betaproteobacteria bacterium]